MDSSETAIRHRPDLNRFETSVGQAVAVAEYTLDGKHITFTHTMVPPALRGMGIAGRLAEAGLDFARQHGLRVVPACSFFEVYIRRNPRHADLLARD